MISDFTASLTNTYPNFGILFTDLSTGGPTSWSWDFGDSTTSTEQNPTKRYSHAGIYTVSLTVNGTTTETKVDYIKINLVGIRQKVNYILVMGKLKTWDYGPPPDRLLLRIMIETGNGNTNSLIKGGGRASLFAQETDPVSTGFRRNNGPTIIFD